MIRTLSRILIFNAGRNIEYRLRGDVFRHLLRLDAGFYRRHPTGDVMSRLTNDLGAVRALFGPGLLNLCNTALVYATTLWLLVHLSPRLTLWALLPYPALLAGARLFVAQDVHASRGIQEQLGVMSTSIQEDLAGVAVIKHYTLEPVREAKFRALNDEYLRRSLALVRARGTLSPLFAMLGGAGTLIVLWAGGREVILGRMTVGGLVAFNAYLVLLSWPTIALGWIIGIWQRGIAGWARVRELLETAPRIADGPATVAGADHRRAVDRGARPDRRGRRAAPARRGVVLAAGRGDAGDRRADRRGEDDAGRRARAACTRWRRAPSAIGGHDLTQLPLARCAARSATRRRTRSCSPRPSPRTSGSAWRPAGPNEADRPRAAVERAGGGRRGLAPDLGRSSPRATTRSSASAASRFRAASGSAWRWRARSAPSRRS